MKKTSFYDLEAVDIHGQIQKMLEFEGKYVLIVNTASQCGFTNQYKGLEELFRKYQSKEFVVLGFPCNQFGKQESGTNAEISNFCSTQYQVTFPMFSKIEVNGKNTHPIYRFLKKKKWGILGGRIIWNFTKFLIDKEGNVIKRYSSKVKPENIEKDLVELMNKF